MRILQLCYNFAPRKTARSGGELRYWQNLASLVELGYQVDLVLFAANDEPQDDVRKLASSITRIDPTDQSISRLESWKSLLFDEDARLFFFPESRGYQEQVRSLVDKLSPDLIWADWIGSMNLIPYHLPVVYSHHDFLFKIKAVRNIVHNRNVSWADGVRLKKLEALERELCKRASFIVCVSHSEHVQLSESMPNSCYIPIVGPTIEPPVNHAAKGRIFLFGSGGNTATRFSRRHLRREIWPMLEKSKPDVEWHVVGRPEPKATDDWRWVEQNFRLHGFVEDLAGVFQVGDASLIPYQEDTGFRTKFVTAAGYGVINIGYEQTFRCAPEFTNGEDCLVASTLSDMVATLKSYAGDAALRRRLGQASRDLYERQFSFEAQLNKYERVITKMAQDALTIPNGSRVLDVAAAH
jgi:glycosyltransferase involved in cell wall biosynthesis